MPRPSRAAGGAVLVIGVGNRLRGDDGVGLAVASRVRAAGIEVREYEGEPVGLIEAWSCAAAVVLVDAVSAGAAPGSVHRFDASSAALPATWSRSTSTHALGVAEAIELARAVGRLPLRVVAVGIEGVSFELGAGLSAEVEGALSEVVEVVLGEARALQG